MIPTTPGSAAGDPTVRQRAEDLHERALIGGIFYLLSWLLVAWQGGAWQRHPLASGLLCFAFVVLGVTRLLLRRWSRANPDRAVAGMRAQWTVLLTTSLLWGGLSAWVLLDPAFAGAHTLTLLATASLAMAFAQIFAVKRSFALLGTGLLFLPMLGIALGRQDHPGVAMVLLLNLAYLIAVIGRSHREYEGKLALDQQLREQRDRFALQSRIDALTGLANRGHFQFCLDHGVASARVDDDPLVLLIADLDHFKSINDRFGHAAGDRCLREIANLLRDSFPGDQSLVSRLGGEEFGVLIGGEAASGAELLAETFRARLARLRIELEDGGRFGLTVSLGLARFSPDVHRGGDALYAAADEALYRAKKGGRNRLEAA